MKPDGENDMGRPLRYCPFISIALEQNHKKKKKNSRLMLDLSFAFNELMSYLKMADILFQLPSCM